MLTLEREFAEGWVFFDNSARFQQTGAFRDGLVGNAPLIVDRDTGQIHITGTARYV